MYHTVNSLLLKGYGLEENIFISSHITWTIKRNRSTERLNTWEKKALNKGSGDKEAVKHTKNLVANWYGTKPLWD